MKNIYVAYALLFFGAIVGGGLHRFYVGDMKLGAAQIALFWVGKLTAGFLLGKVLLFAWSIWWLIDLVITIDMVESANENALNKA
ncbi:MAG: TM2 domain-containing protein [Campylobacteraceae bacterium]|nr:TM2 domain-containing protein [Campylobacteraceae bacterium]